MARLSLLNEKVETMKKQRETLVQDLRKKIEADDITKLVLMRRQENHKVRMKLFLIYSFLLSQSLFSDQLKKHEELINIIKQNCTAQDNILQSLSDANADIADLRAKMILISER